jgi:hypothetical protein
VHSNQVSASFHVYYFSTPTERFLPKELSQISLQFPAGHMQLPSTRHCSFIIAGILLNQKGRCKSALRLSFEQLFSSIRSFPIKRTISNVRSNSRRGTWNDCRQACAGGRNPGQMCTRSSQCSESYCASRGVSERVLDVGLQNVLEFSLYPGVGHTTFRTEGQCTFIMELLSSMIRPLTPTPLTR